MPVTWTVVDMLGGICFDSVLGVCLLLKRTDETMVEVGVVNLLSLVRAGYVTTKNPRVLQPRFACESVVYLNDVLPIHTTLFAIGIIQLPIQQYHDHITTYIGIDSQASKAMHPPSSINLISSPKTALLLLPPRQTNTRNGETHKQ